MKIVNCSVHKNCEERFHCNVSKRIFYVYKDEHLAVLDKPEKLDKKIIIDNRYSFKKDPLAKFQGREVYGLAAKVLYQYYEVMPWDTCYWYIDYYEEILASIFLFCPEILCYAIKQELNVLDKADMHVASAIKKCLDFSIRLDKKIGDEEKSTEKNNFYKRTLNEINSFHIIRELEIALTKGVDQYCEIGEIVKKVMDISSNVVSKTKRKLLEWSEKEDKKVFERALKKLIGNNNYKYLYDFE